MEEKDNQPKSGTSSSSVATRDRQLVDRLTALSEINAQLSTSLDPDVVLRTVLDKATALMGAWNGSIMLIDPRGEKLTIRTALGLPEDVIKTTEVKLGSGIAGYVAQTGQPKNLRRGFKDRYSQTDETASEIKAALCVPLTTRGRAIGVLNVSDRIDGEDFTEEDLSLLETLSTSAAVAIENARLHDSLEAKVQELSALYTVALAVSTSLDRDKVLQQVLEQATGLLYAANGSIMLINEDQDHLDIVAATGLSDEILQSMKPKVGEGIAGYVAQTGKPKILLKGFKDRYSQTDQAAEAVPSAMCVPLIVNEAPIGVLNVSDKDGNLDFDDSDLSRLTNLAALAGLAIEKATLYGNLQDMFMGTIRSLASSIDARDPYTQEHSSRVAAYSVVIARRLGLPEEEIEQLRIGALLHDVGKIGVKDEILRKAGGLTDEEFTEMKSHPQRGAKILEEVKRLKELLPVMHHHHEHYKGRGYPHGLSGEEIPLGARIVAVADTFDAMTSNRPYRKALSPEVAVAKIKEIAGTQLDPTVVTAFLAAVEAGEIEDILEKE